LVSTHSSAGRGGSFRSLMMKHTQGKWIVVEIGNKKNRYGIDDDGYPVAEVVGEANANLMAAAPEMLEMLKECKDVLDIYKDNFTVEIEELITKAEGCSDKDGEEIDSNINDLMGGVVNAMSGRY